MSTRTPILFLAAFLLAQSNHLAVMVIALFAAGCAFVSAMQDQARQGRRRL